jgi:putative aldouronate transport system substrate-binding protein
MGLPPIQNLTDFENALIKAKKTFPGTTPMLLIMGDIGLQYFYQIFGMTAGSTNLYEDNGQIKFRINHPAYKETLQFMNKLYREGLISAEMLTYKAEQSTAVMDGGKCFSAAGFATSADSDNAKYKNNKIEGVWSQLPVMLSDKVSYTDDSAGWAGVFVTKKCKDPARAIKFLEFMKSDEGSKLANWGIEGQQYTPDKDGYPVWTPEFKEVMKDGDKMVKTVGISAWQFCSSGKYEGIRNFNPDMPTGLKCLQDWKKVYQFKPWFQQIIPQIDTDENNVYTKLNQLASDAEIQLIVQKSEADFNKKFDETMKKAEDSGMKDFEKLLTDRYTEVIKRYKN